MGFDPTGTSKYNSFEVSVNAPDQDGVYGILNNDGNSVYVGSGNIKDRLLSHLTMENRPADPCIERCLPTDCVWEANESPLFRIAREIELINELKPPCNSR